MHRSPLALIALLCAAWPATPFRPARRVQIHRLRTTAATQTPACAQGTTCTMTYFGGKVLANVKVYQVNWSSSVDSAVAGALPGFYRAVTNSAYMDWLSEYDTNVAAGGGSHQGGAGTNQHIGRGTFGGSFTITPSNSSTDLTDAEISAELDEQISAGNLPPPDDNTLYVTGFPPDVTIDDGTGSTSCVDFCAYHSTFARGAQSVAYAVIPDHGAGSGCDLGCGSGTPLQNTTDSISHEMVESITDFEVGLDTSENYDFPAAWGNDANGEIGDVCDGSDTITGEGDATPYTVQLIYSNSRNLCVGSVLKAQDFKVFMKPAAASLAQGNSAVIPVSTAITNGAAQPLTLSVSGLPTGVTGAFDPASIDSGGSAQLTLTASATAAPAKDAVVVVTGAGAVTHTAALLLQISGTAAGGNDFTIAVTPSSQSIPAGAAGTYTVSTALASGTAENIALAVSGLPAGVTADLANDSVAAGSGTTLTLTVDDAAAAVSGATFTVTGTAPSATHTATAHVSVVPQGTANTFSITLAPESRTLLPGGSATFSATTAVTNGSAEDIALTVADLPSGVTGTFSPASIKAGATSTLTLQAAANAPAAGATTFTVTATAPSDEETANADVGVLAGDFSISMTPAKSTVAPGKNATFTVATSITTGAPGSLTLTLSGLPGGVTGEFDSDVIDAGQKATLTLSAASDALPAAATTFTVQGEDDDGLQHSATGQISVSGNDFSLSITPAAATVGRGDSATFTVATALASGSAETLALSASGLPAGVTAKFTPASVSAGQSSALVFTASATAALGATDVTITGTAASAEHTATAKLTVATAPAPPAVTLDAPLEAATVSGTVAIHATATPPVGATLARIDILFDGQTRWNSTASPALITWDTAQETNGQHTLSARATDLDGAAGNSATVTVTVSNSSSTTPPASGGGCASGGAGAGAALGLLAAICSLHRRRRPALAQRDHAH